MPKPAIRVVRGQPDDAELAALLVALSVLAARPPTHDEQPVPARANWDRDRQSRFCPPGAWTSGLR
jgi:hypothetical protein